MKNLSQTFHLLLILCYTISSFAQTPGDVCNNAITYPGDVVNNICVTSFDFSNFNSFDGPVATCGISSDVTAWFNFTAPIITLAGDPLYLYFDNGDGLINNCYLSTQFFLTNCSTPVSNCIYFDSGVIGELIQGNDYLMLVWDGSFQGGFSCDFCLTLATTPPQGNECDDAISYNGDIINGTCINSLDISGYSNSATSPSLTCGYRTVDQSVWYTVTMPVTTVAGAPIDIYFENGDDLVNDCNLSVEFYALDCNTPVSNCIFGGSGVITGLNQGVDYLMLIENYQNQTICDFCLTLPPPLPANNDCSGATPYPANIANGGCVFDFDFSEYTDSGLSPSPSCDAGDPNAWFTFTAPITTSAGEPTALQWYAGYYCSVGIEVYEPDCLTPVSDCLNNSSGLVTGLIQGNNYYAVIWADGADNDYCNFCLTVPPPPEPGNECYLPLPYPGDVVNNTCVYDFDIGDYISSELSPATDCGLLSQKTVWFTLTTPVTTAAGNPIDLEFEALSSGTAIQFYSTDCSTAITDCIYSLGIITGLQQGTDYLVAVATEVDPPGASSDVSFCLGIALPAPANDVCSGAIPYPGDVLNGVCVEDYNFLIANISENSNIPSCNDPFEHSTLWFSWTAPIITAAGDPLNLMFDNGQGQENNCYLGIEFYNTDCITSESACVRTGSNIITGLVQGEDYLMLVFDRFSGDQACDFCLRVAPPYTQGNECVDPLPYPGDIANGSCATGVDFSNITFTSDSPVIYCALAYQTRWYTITTPVTTSAGEPLDLFFDAGNCDLSIWFVQDDCFNGLNICEVGSGIVTNLEQGRDYLIAINNSAASSSEICDFCITLEDNTCPIVSFSGLPTNTSSSSAITLNGFPAGGTFSGNGVLFSAFNPVVSGPGIHTITYTYNDGSGCSGFATEDIFVFTIDYVFVDYNLGTILPRINMPSNNESLSLKNIYPVPFRETINVDLNSLENETVLVAIRSIKGKIVQQIEVNLLEGLNTITLNVDLLAKGNYYLMIQNQNRIIQIPILK